MNGELVSAGYVTLLQWDNYGLLGANDNGCALSIYRSDHLAHLECWKPGGGSADLGGSAVALPTGQWFYLEVHQRVSSSAGTTNEVYLNGTRVSSSAAANNVNNNSIDRLRYGIVGIATGAQTDPFDLWFDRCYWGTRQLGPLP